MDRIDTINGWDRKVPDVTQCDPGIGIDDEDIQLLMYTVYISLMVYNCNTINGKLTRLIPCGKGSKLMSRMAIGEAHISILIIDHKSRQWLQKDSMQTLTVHGWLCEAHVDCLRSLWQDPSTYSCGLWQLRVGTDKTSVIAQEATYRIIMTIRADSANWLRALKDQGDSMESLWQDHGNYTCGLWQLTMGSDKTRVTLYRASDEIMVTTLATDREFWLVLAMVLAHEKPGPLHLGRLPPRNPAFASPDIPLQLSIWVLIISWHDLYVHCAVFAGLSSPALRFAIPSIFVESLSKTCRCRLQSSLILEPLKEYQSDRKSESGRWKSLLNCTIYVYTMLWYDQNSKT